MPSGTIALRVLLFVLPMAAALNATTNTTSIQEEGDTGSNVVITVSVVLSVCALLACVGVCVCVLRKPKTSKGSIVSRFKTLMNRKSYELVDATEGYGYSEDPRPRASAFSPPVLSASVEQSLNMKGESGL